MLNVVPVGAVRHRPSDLTRAFGWSVVLAMVALTTDSPGPITRSLRDLVDAIPDVVQPWLDDVYRWGTLLAVLAAFGTALGRRRWRFLAALAATSALVTAVGWWLVDGLDLASSAGDARTPYPAVRLALAVGAAVVAGPHVTRPLRRALLGAIGVACVGSISAGDAIVVDVVGGYALGAGAAALVNFLLGSPAGTPAVSQVRQALAERNVDVRDLEPAERQVWGETRFRAVGVDGTALSVSVIGRDAADARLLTRLWRTVWYRDLGASIAVTRVGQIEHHAFVLLLAAARGVPVPAVVSAGVGGPRDDALLVTTVPPGRSLVELRLPVPPRPAGADPDQPPPPPPVDETGAVLSDDALDRIWVALGSLHRAGLAHGGVDGHAVVVADHGEVTLVDVDRGTADAAPERMALDEVALLVAVADVVGERRSLAAARRALDDEALAALLPVTTPAALPSIESGRRGLVKRRCTELRQQGAELLGVEVPEPQELRRVKPTDIVLALGSVLGVYLLVGQLSDIGSVWTTFGSAVIGWVVVCALVSQLPPIGAAVAMVGSVSQQQLPLGQTTLLQYSNKFTGLVGGTWAGLAVFTRYLQKQGLGVATAASSAALTSAAQGLAQTALFAVALLATRGHFSGGLSSRTSSGAVDLGTVVVVVLAVLVVIGVAVGVPRLRHAVTRVVRPQWRTARDNARGVLAEPRRAALLLGGNLAAQLFYALGLKLALQAYGVDLPLLDFVVINTIASILGGIAPVPGGMGVIEAGLIAGLTAAGVPNDTAVATTFTYRAFTAYLPPIWGWFCLADLRRRDLV